MTITLFQAFDTFIIDKQASGMSNYTIRNYRNTLSKLRLYFDDKPLLDFTRSDWIGFMNWLQHEHISAPAGIAPREPQQLSPKSAKNIHTDISSFYTWATSPGVDLVTDHIMATIKSPRCEVLPIETLTKDQFQKLLTACDHSQEWRTAPGRRSARATRLRDRAILHILLSTGVRVSELCGLRYCDIDSSTRSLRVSGKGKGRDSKQRTVYFGKSAHRALWLYLAPRLDTIGPNDHVFITEEGAPMDRTRVSRLIREIGKRAGVKAYPHLFRHTFATEFLRNNGDLLKLQQLLGHTTLEMVRRYAHIVAADCAAAHAAADPADNWRVR